MAYAVAENFNASLAQKWIRAGKAIRERWGAFGPACASVTDFVLHKFKLSEKFRSGPGPHCSDRILRIRRPRRPPCPQSRHQGAHGRGHGIGVYSRVHGLLAMGAAFEAGDLKFFGDLTRL